MIKISRMAERNIRFKKVCKIVLRNEKIKKKILEFKKLSKNR